MRVQSLAALVLCALAASCASTPPIETPSGRPECTVKGTSPAEVQAYCLERFIAGGWMLRSQTPNQVVFWRENDSELQNVLLGSQYDPTTTYEVRLVLTGAAGDTHVYGQVALVTNEGSAFERRSDLTSGRSGYELWQSLREVSDHFKPVADGAEPASVSAVR